VEFVVGTVLEPSDTSQHGIPIMIKCSMKHRQAYKFVSRKHRTELLELNFDVPGKACVSFWFED